MLPPLEPPAPPRSKTDHRFKFVSEVVCEWPEAYHVGGYHPVQLGDVLNGRYTVIRKIGYGSYSTVWLAVDQRISIYFAVKITKSSQYTRTGEELSVYRRLCRTKANVHSSQKNLVALLDSFDCHGPNGTHLCLVYEAMGPPAQFMLETSPICQDGEFWMRRFPSAWGRRMLRDVLLGLHFLHSHGVVHGDLHMGNILLAIKPLDATSTRTKSLYQQHSGAKSGLERLDGRTDDVWAPKYILAPEPLFDYLSFELDPLAKIGDLGSAFLEERPPAHLATPPHLRAPELVLRDRQLGHWVDMWSFGCLIYELITGSPLFYVERMEGSRWDEQANDKHLLQITEVIQPLPKRLLSKWRRVGSYYTTQGDRLETDSDDETTDASAPLASSEQYDPLEVKFMEKKPIDMDDKEGADVVSIMRMVLRPDPLERASAAQILKEPWFNR